MSDLLKQLLARPYATEVIQEFARHIKRKTEPGLFAAAYLELMRSQEEAPRRETTFILMFASSRSWDEIKGYLIGKVTEDDRDILNTPEAKVFYDKWLKMVSKQVAEYYNDLLKDEEGEGWKSGEVVG